MLSIPPKPKQRYLDVWSVFDIILYCPNEYQKYLPKEQTAPMQVSGFINFFIWFIRKDYEAQWIQANSNNTVSFS